MLIVRIEVFKYWEKLCIRSKSPKWCYENSKLPRKEKLVGQNVLVSPQNAYSIALETPYDAMAFVVARLIGILCLHYKF